MIPIMSEKNFKRLFYRLLTLPPKGNLSNQELRNIKKAQVYMLARHKITLKGPKV